MAALTNRKERWCFGTSGWMARDVLCLINSLINKSQIDIDYVRRPNSSLSPSVADLFRRLSELSKSRAPSLTISLSLHVSRQSEFPSVHWDIHRHCARVCASNVFDSPVGSIDSSLTSWQSRFEKKKVFKKHNVCSQEVQDAS